MSTNTIILTTFLAITLLSPLTVVQPAVGRGVSGLTWDRTYAAGYDILTSVQQTHDQGFILSTNNLLIKTNAAGMPEWQRSYSILGYYSSGRVTLTSDGGYLIVGTAEAWPNLYGWLAKLDRDGNVEWSKTYGNGGFVSGLQTPDGGYVVVANNGIPEDAYSFFAGNSWVSKLDASGNILWQKTLPGQDVHSVDLASDRGFIIAGTAWLPTRNAAGFNSCEADSPICESSVPWLVKLDENGTVEWQKTYDFSINSKVPGTIQLVQEAYSAHQTFDGGYIAVGEKAALGPDGGCGEGCYYDTLIFKLNASGDILWQKEFRGGEAITVSVHQTSNGGFLIAGGGFCCIGLGHPWLLRLNAHGALVWQKVFPEGGSGLFTQATDTRDGGIIAVGINDLHPSGPVRFFSWAVKLDSDGNIRGCSTGVPSSAAISDTYGIVTDTSLTVANTSTSVAPTNVIVVTPTVVAQELCKGEPAHKIGSRPIRHQ